MKERDLKDICQKEKYTDKRLVKTGYLFHRKISIFFTRFFLRFPSILPDHITVLMILISFCGFFILVLTEDVWYSFFALLLFYLGFLLDKVDGEVARYRKIFSLRGIYLDDIYHLVIPSLLLMGFFWKFLLHGGSMSVWVLFLVWSASLARIIVSKMGPSAFFKVKGKRILASVPERHKKHAFMFKFLNLFLWKPWSFVMRFDLLLLFLVLVLFFSLSVYSLFFLSCCFLVVIFRTVTKNVLGKIDTIVDRLANESRNF